MIWITIFPMKIILKWLIFFKEFNNKEELDLDIKYKKNDKKNLMPVNYFLDLKKLYLNEFEKKTYQQESIF